MNTETSMGIVISPHNGEFAIGSGFEIGLFSARTVAFELANGSIAMVARFFGQISGLAG